jgi:hypothetical protein
MNHKLSIDEYAALEQTSKLLRGEKPNACISRNSKKLIGIKLLAHRKDGGFELTEVGRQVLFIKHCIDGLRSISTDSDFILTSPVIAFLGKKGHIEQDSESEKWRISVRGLECLTDIDSQISEK